MPGPNFTFAFIVATLWGAVFHVVVGGDARRLTLFLLAGWIGFLLGQMTGNSLGVQFFTIGELHIVPASIGALIALLIAYIISSNRTSRRRPLR
jgi:ABC-type antimicrobial peptide transport system permease subunit